MIKHLKYHEINSEKYRHCIENSCQYTVSATLKYIDAYGKSHWEFLILDDYFAVMPIYVVRKMGLKFVTIPFGIQQLGIFSSIDSVEINDYFLQYLKTNFRVHCYQFNEHNRFSSEIDWAKNYVIPQQNYSDAKSNFSKDRRRNVKILDKNKSKIHFTEHSDILEFEAFFLVHSKGIYERNKQLMFSIFYNLYQQKLLKIYALFFNNEIASIAFLLEDDCSIYTTALVNHPNFLNENCPSILLDHILQKYISTKSLSFMGSNQKSIQDFFKRFGAEERRYAVIKNSKKELIFQLFKF